MALIKGLEYYSIVDFTRILRTVFLFILLSALCSLFHMALSLLALRLCKKYLLGGLYIDTGLQVKTKEAKMEDFSFLDRFGKQQHLLKTIYGY